MLPQQQHHHHHAAGAPFIAVPIGGSGGGAYSSTTAPPATLDALAAQQLSSPWHPSLMTTFHHHQHQFHQPSPHHAYHHHDSSVGQLLSVSLPAHHASTLHHAQTFHLMPTYGAYAASPLYQQPHEYMAWSSAESQLERRSQHTDAATMQLTPPPTASVNHHTFVDAATVVRLEHHHHHHQQHHHHYHHHPSSASPLNVVAHAVPSYPMHDGTSSPSLPTVGGFHMPSATAAAAAVSPLHQLPLPSEDSSAPPPFIAPASAARAAASRPATASPGTLRWSDSRQKRPAKPVEVPPAAPGDSEPGPRQVIVNYLATNIDSEGLGCLFSQYGPIDSVRVVTDGPNGQSRGYGFVYFKSHADAVQAVADASGRVLLGKRVRASYAVPQRNLMTFLELGGIPVSEEAKRMVAAQLQQQQSSGASAVASPPPQ